MVERPESSLRPPWFDTMIASMPASAASTRVLVREDALEHDFHVGRVAQPLEEVPGHGGGLGIRQAGEVDAPDTSRGA